MVHVVYPAHQTQLLSRFEFVEFVVIDAWRSPRRGQSLSGSVLYYESDRGRLQRRPWGAASSADGADWDDQSARLCVPFGPASEHAALRGRVRYGGVVEVTRALVARLHEVTMMMKSRRAR